ncbi:ATP-dependent DNA ligase [Couchioplanes caeruleus]|uniref:ATP-dependent DNA ligase n=1 Tax=Couchioplanes caeruleus TaxID=56438 RepID=UPI000B1A8146
MLEDLRVRGAGVDTPPSFVDGAAEVYAAAQEHGLEGIVYKRLTAPYRPGQRAKTWVKTVSVRQEAVYVPTSSSSRRHHLQPVVHDTCRRRLPRPSERVRRAPVKNTARWLSSGCP